MFLKGNEYFNFSYIGKNLGPWGGGCKGRWVERGEKGRIGESLEEWVRWDGGRVDMEAGK